MNCSGTLGAACAAFRSAGLFSMHMQRPSPIPGNWFVAWNACLCTRLGGDSMSLRTSVVFNADAVKCWPYDY